MANKTWNLPAPPGFQGLQSELALTGYVRHLPHWRQMGATYFVTFRLADSLPQAKLRELAVLKEKWCREGSKQQDAESKTEQRSVLLSEEGFARRVMLQVETWLDQGIGACWLKRAPLREIVVAAMHYFDGARYELGCYVIMPNHVHAVIRNHCNIR